MSIPRTISIAVKVKRETAASMRGKSMTEGKRSASRKAIYFRMENVLKES
ncbi:hypothetical protein LEP1GSC061_0592 [Leptospira wolffii serovar Khorat str. Khorat-H2]|nr:hypothetical protein LEP1GSC061_0592 [Leptospira wolffii serovar Khorat str. Khorat-H2]